MRLHQTWILFGLSIAAGYSNPAEAAGAHDAAAYRGADRQTRLEQGAKAEGEFVWYTSVPAKGSSALFTFIGTK